MPVRMPMRSVDPALRLHRHRARSHRIALRARNGSGASMVDHPVACQLRALPRTQCTLVVVQQRCLYKARSRGEYEMSCRRPGGIYRRDAHMVSAAAAAMAATEATATPAMIAVEPANRDISPSVPARPLLVGVGTCEMAMVLVMAAVLLPLLLPLLRLLSEPGVAVGNSVSDGNRVRDTGTVRRTLVAAGVDSNRPAPELDEEPGVGDAVAALGLTVNVLHVADAERKGGDETVLLDITVVHVDDSGGTAVGDAARRVSNAVSDVLDGTLPALCVELACALVETPVSDDAYTVGESVDGGGAEELLGLLDAVADADGTSHAVLLHVITDVVGVAAADASSSGSAHKDNSASCIMSDTGSSVASTSRR